MMMIEPLCIACVSVNHCRFPFHHEKNHSVRSNECFILWGHVEVRRVVKAEREKGNKEYTSIQQMRYQNWNIKNIESERNTS